MTKPAHRNYAVHVTAHRIYWPLLIKDYWGEPVATRRTLAYVIRSPRTGTQSFLKEVRQAVWSVNGDFL